jgi:hypothetical protein
MCTGASGARPTSPAAARRSMVLWRAPPAATALCGAGLSAGRPRSSLSSGGSRSARPGHRGGQAAVVAPPWRRASSRASAPVGRSLRGLCARARVSCRTARVSRNTFARAHIERRLRQRRTDGVDTRRAPTRRDPGKVLRKTHGALAGVERSSRANRPPASGHHPTAAPPERLHHSMPRPRTTAEPRADDHRAAHTAPSIIYARLSTAASTVSSAPIARGTSAMRSASAIGAPGATTSRSCWPRWSNRLRSW